MIITFIVSIRKDWNSLPSGIRTSVNFSLFKDHCFSVLEIIDRCNLFYIYLSYFIYLFFIFYYIIYLIYLYICIFIFVKESFHHLKF